MNIVQRLRYPLSGNEPSYEIARRLAIACSPGMVMRVRDEYFRVLHVRPVVIRKTSPEGLNGSPIALVEDPTVAPVVPRAVKPIPPPVVVEEPPETIEDPPETLDEPVVIPDIVASKKEASPTTKAKSEPKTTIQVGQQWMTKDSRRKQVPFTLVAVNEDHVVADDGRAIKLDRFSRYRLVSGS